MKLTLQYKSNEDERLTEILNNKEFDKLTDADLCKVVKKCTKCNVDKTLSCYVKNKKGFLGRNPQCKDCVKEYTRVYYKTHSEPSAKWIVQIL